MLNTDENKLSLTLLAVIFSLCPLRQSPEGSLRVPRVPHLSDSREDEALGTRLVSSYVTGHELAVSAELR